MFHTTKITSSLKKNKQYCQSLETEGQEKRGTLNEHDRMAEFYMKNRRKKINYWNKINTIAINKDNGG